MSVLLIGDHRLTRPVAERLLAQGDEVRALGTTLGPELAGLGVHVARGPYLDDDLIERAAQNVRTIVVFEPTLETASVVVAGAANAGVGRIVVVGSRLDDAALSALTGSSLEHVILRVPRPGVFTRALDEGRIAEAVDAADDLPGELRMDLDLANDDAWRALRIANP